MKELKKIFIIPLIILPFVVLSQSKIGVIKDKDGYTNIRTDRNNRSEIIGKVIDKEYFTYFENKESNWWLIETVKGQFGYVHESRILFVQNGYVQNGKLTNKKVMVTEKIENLQQVVIKIIQLRPSEDSYEFSCRGLIRTIKGNKIINEINYGNIEPVGSSFGLVYSKKQNNKNLFIASKFGDYSGEIIIIDESGKIQNFQGGQYFITKNEKYLVSGWSSDLSGLTIYDLKKKQIRFNNELDFYLGDWYLSDNIYFSPLWNGERELEQTYQIDFDNFQLKKSKLKTNDVGKIKMKNEDCYCN